MPRTKGSKNKHTNSTDKTSVVVKTEKNPWDFLPAESSVDILKDVLRKIVNGDYDKQELLDRINSML